MIYIRNDIHDIRDKRAIFYTYFPYSIRNLVCKKGTIKDAKMLFKCYLQLRMCNKK